LKRVRVAECGQFGLGFLSAFLIASEVSLTTRSFRGGRALRWHSGGDEFYEVAPGRRDEVGTTIELHVKPAASFLLRKKELVEAVRCCADFLPTPIYLEGRPAPINRQAPPWEDDAPDAAIRAYIARTLHGIEPLHVLRLHDGQVRVADGTLTIPLQGFLFVPPGSVASVHEYRDLTVYIRRMLICDRERDLLPNRRVAQNNGLSLERNERHGAWRKHGSQLLAPDLDRQVSDQVFAAFEERIAIGIGMGEDDSRAAAQREAS